MHAFQMNGNSIQKQQENFSKRFFFFIIFLSFFFYYMNLIKADFSQYGSDDVMLLSDIIMKLMSS
jgi:hypothetical protein